MVKKRSVFLIILLSIVTLGIYPFVMYCIIGNEVNMICEGDGKKNMHYILVFLLGFVTFGIYPSIWVAKAMDRLQDNAYRYGGVATPTHSGSSYLLWFWLGALIGIGPLIAVIYFIDDVNAFAGITPETPRQPYIPNRAQRMMQGQNMGMMNGPVSQPIPSVPPQGAVPPVPPQPVVPAGGAPMPPVSNGPDVDSVPPTEQAPGYNPSNANGNVLGVGGMYKGMPFPIMQYEELIIGTNPAVSNVVISENGDYVSKKHVSIRYNSVNGTYLVTDFSSNGTFMADGTKLESGVPTVINKGTEIILGTNDNIFRLG